MNKIFKLLASVYFIANYGILAAQPLTCHFSNIYGDTGDDYFRSLYYDLPTKNYYVAGLINTNAGILKLDSNGIVLNTYNYSNLSDIKKIISASNNNNLLFATNTNDDLQITRIDLQGNIIWSKKYSSGIERFVDLCEGTNNEYYVACWYASTGISDDLLIMKIDGSGTVLWSKILDDVDDQLSDIIPNGSGGVVAVGGLHSSPIEQFIVEIDKFGNIQQQRKLTSISSLYYQSKGIVKDKSGNYIITGYISLNSQRDIIVQKLSASFNLIWATSIEFPGLDQAIDVDIDDSDNVYISYYHPVNNDNKASYSKLSSSGSHLWSKYVDGYRWGYLDIINDNGMDHLVSYGSALNNPLGFGGYDGFLFKEDLNLNTCYVNTLTPSVNPQLFNNVTWNPTVNSFTLPNIDFITSVQSIDIESFNLCDSCYNSTNIIEDNNPINQIYLYPQLASEYITLEFELLQNQYLDISIVNALGKEISTIYKGNSPKGLKKYNKQVSILPGGTYFVILKNQKTLHTLRFIKR